ncbi:mersacidin/lichenicidin family type 2 lantibiotic [Dictyobacter formicarum]|uniref:Nif11 domain-containing protein n=1 Tax=Dictyobacter formicarum TaxID=2778368 RepID=A0ABQ3V8U8_9CHLR|nr:mersacidin/lichenicidin family type 2 lantibiotic [Dictyobacter formicarum]GHO82200.1 hypothetical protein KSZ_02060 [Dictyobacter formicarum]
MANQKREIDLVRAGQDQAYRSSLETAGIDVVRVWKDEEYRASLIDQGYSIHESPAGAEELNDAELAKIAGGIYRSHGPQPQYEDSCAQTGMGWEVCGTKDLIGNWC